MSYNKVYYQKNKAQQIERAIKWGKANPKRRKLQQEKYELSHSFRRMMLRANKRCKEKISSFDIWKIAKNQKLKCALTGDRLTRKNISLDHILAKAKGGKNVPSNLRLVTKDANFLKNTHSDKDLLILCQKVVQTLQSN